MTSTLVYLYGPPAVGKLTVATALHEQTGIRLFHNHLTVDAIKAVFDFASPPFTEVVHRTRLDVFDPAVRQLDPAPLHPDDLVIDTSTVGPAAAASQIAAHLDL